MGGFSSFQPKSADRADVDRTGELETCRKCDGTGSDDISICVECNGTGSRKYGPKAEKNPFETS